MLDRLTPYIWFAIVAVLFMLVGSLLRAFLIPQGALIGAEVICMLGFALFIRKQFGEPGASGGNSWPSWRHAGTRWWGLLLVLASGGLFGLTANALGGLVTITVPGMKERAEAYAQTVEQMLAPGDPLAAALAIVGVSIFAPLCEEAFFRGTLLPVQRDYEPAWMAILFNGLLFSLLHMNAVGALSLALLGMLMAHLTIRSRSIWPAIFCHAGVNTFNGVVLPAISEQMGVEVARATPELSEVLLALAVLLPASGATWWWLTTRLFGAPGDVEQAHAEP